MELPYARSGEEECGKQTKRFKGAVGVPCWQLQLAFQIALRHVLPLIVILVAALICLHRHGEFDERRVFESTVHVPQGELRYGTVP